MEPRAVWYMLASAFGFSAMAMLVKVASKTLPTGEIVLARAVVTLVVSYIMVRRAALPLWGTRGRRRMLTLRALLGLGGLSLYYLSLAHLPLADATVIQNTTPLLVSVLAWWILREPLGWPNALALAFGIAGVMLVAHPTATHAALSPAGVAIGLGATVCASLAYVTVRSLARTEHPLIIVWYFPLIATPLVVPWAVATWVTPSPLEWLVLLMIGLATQVGQVFMTMALAIERAGRVTSLGYIQIAFAMVWQWGVFGSAPPAWTIGGALLIIAGTSVLARATEPEGRSLRGERPDEPAEHPGQRTDERDRSEHVR